jgi:hypothetical protein
MLSTLNDHYHKTVKNIKLYLVLLLSYFGGLILVLTKISTKNNSRWWNSEKQYATKEASKSSQTKQQKNNKVSLS